MQKKTTDTLTMTIDNRNIVTQTEFNNGLTRLDEKFKWLRILTNEDEKRKSLRFAFVKISPNAHLAHLQIRTNQHITKASQKSQITPTLKMT